jgi:hypothetical protein
MLAMIPDRCIRFQAKFRVAIKEICALMPKRRTSRCEPAVLAFTPPGDALFSRTS